MSGWSPFPVLEFQAVVEMNCSMTSNPNYARYCASSTAGFHWTMNHSSEPLDITFRSPFSLTRPRTELISSSSSASKLWIRLLTYSFRVVHSIGGSVFQSGCHLILKYPMHPRSKLQPINADKPLLPSKASLSTVYDIMSRDHFGYTQKWVACLCVKHRRTNLLAWTSRKASRTLVRPTNIAVSPQAWLAFLTLQSSNLQHPSSESGPINRERTTSWSLRTAPPPAVHTPTPPLPANMLNTHGTSAGEYDVVGRLGVDRQ
ncbi:uncharacterized protein CLUP02_16823 [Colletotrichum lupini]|uniref:Uncharacterized protein n=1 Tax=Colletotrichum lupini TaxID=145971 RepID=A0A9Q8T8J6_9PEZI|nr:uncharacterized protein CLUP02_16823 [Colletotrichum lupini]UQC91289.1 hypothetical protein CLUP02_16823 [Colletotrichum lupini]